MNKWGFERRDMPKTGEDEGGWYITDGQGRGRRRVQYLSVAAVSVVGTVRGQVGL